MTRRPSRPAADNSRSPVENPDRAGMRILAIDPGLKRIGLAVSDPTGTVAHGLAILPHRSAALDSARILEIARAEDVGKILLGMSAEPGHPPDGLVRFIHRLLAALRAGSAIPVVLHDESFSTGNAQRARRERGDRLKTRRSADDSLAAAAFLQEYLDVQANRAE
jgi:putative Holliday junction resolvase